METLVIIMIEDIIAVENLTEILTVDNIDVFLVAPGDLGQSMGLLDRTDPKVLSAIDKAITQIVESGKTAGTLVDSTNVESYIDKGVKYFCTVITPWLQSGSAEFLNKIEKHS